MIASIPVGMSESNKTCSAESVNWYYFFNLADPAQFKLVFTTATLGVLFLIYLELSPISDCEIAEVTNNSRQHELKTMVLK